MKIEHNGMTVTIDEEKLNKGERWKAENDVRGFLDLLAAGHIRYMDLDVKNEPESGYKIQGPIFKWDDFAVELLSEQAGDKL